VSHTFAVERLKMAIELGWLSRHTLENHADFQELKSYPAFQEVAQKKTAEKQ
jgi:hypothetical protein